jgi:hypothetical protein
MRRDKPREGIYIRYLVRRGSECQANPPPERDKVASQSGLASHALPGRLLGREDHVMIASRDAKGRIREGGREQER